MRINVLHEDCLYTGHYENTPMQYTAIFHGCKNGHFQMKMFNIFLIFAQNIDCGYTLEPPHCKPQFYYTKVGCKGVYIKRTCFHDEPVTFSRR